LKYKSQRFDTLVGNQTTRWEYVLGVTREDYTKGVRKSEAEVTTFNRQFDYHYGEDVSDAPGYEQYTFTSPRAFEILNAASIIKLHWITPEGKLELYQVVP